MKVMNGLSMIRQLKDLNISCAYLILSGYSEFEYARELSAWEWRAIC